MTLEAERSGTGAGATAAAVHSGGPTQERVRVTLALVGGYWRPLAAVARLLEELGELAEEGPRADSVSGELADLWIITTALADQFLARVGEPGSPLAGADRDAGDLPALLAAGGRIARIVNHYDGPKAPRTLEGWISLEQATARFHSELAGFARSRGVDLADAVAVKLDAIPALDAGRFRAVAHDPSTAASLERLRASDGQHSYLARARLWGSPEWAAAPADEGLRRIAADLASFVKAAAGERLDAYAIAAPAPAGPGSPSDWVQWLLAWLTASREGARLAGGPGEEGLSLSFDGVPLAVTVLPGTTAAFVLLRAPGSLALSGSPG